MNRPILSMEAWVKSLAWPALLASSGGILALGFSRGGETLYFNLSYAWIVAWLFLLERRFVNRAEWRLADGQIGPDLSHTLLNKGLVQLFIVTILTAAGGT